MGSLQDVHIAHGRWIGSEIPGIVSGDATRETVDCLGRRHVQRGFGLSHVTRIYSCSQLPQVPMDNIDLSQVPSNGGQQEDPQAAAAKREKEEEMRRDVMATVLDTAARERCRSSQLSTTHTSNDLF